MYTLQRLSFYSMEWKTISTFDTLGEAQDEKTYFEAFANTAFRIVKV